MVKKFQYTEESMENALRAVAEGMSVNKASKSFNVPRTTLLYKHTGKTPIDRKMGPQAILANEEEAMIENWIIHLGKGGFPVTKHQLLDSVQMLIKKTQRPTPFSECRPGRHWYEGFLKRHPKIARRVSQNLTPSRASVKEESIRNWFNEVKEYVTEEGLDDVFKDPKRIFNCDETAFFLSPSENRVLVQKGSKSVYNMIASGEKENITTLVMASAAGSLPPPMVIFQFQRIPQRIAASVPKQWGLGRSEKGWMTGETFYEYITNIFYPWLVTEGIEFPILLFVDGHSSHLTISLSEFCIEKKIVLISLYPNSTHLLQPLDVAVFHSLKSSWKKAVHEWRIQHCHEKLKNEDFCPLLEKVMKTITPNMLINGFRKCGLHPWNPNNVDYSKSIRMTSEAVAAGATPQANSEIEVNLHLRFFEMEMSEEKITSFQRNANENWKGDIADENLFYFWRKLKIKANEFIASNIETEENVVFEVEDNELFEMRNGNLYAKHQLRNVDFCAETSDGINVEISADVGSGRADTSDGLIIDHTKIAIGSYDATCSVEPVHKTPPSNTQIFLEESIHCVSPLPVQNYYIPRISLPITQRDNEQVLPSSLTMKATVPLPPTATMITTALPTTTAAATSTANTTIEVPTPTAILTGTTLAAKEVPTAKIASIVTAPSTSTAATDFILPSPFKSTFFWPNTPKAPLKRKREKIPSVATSDKWLTYYKKKESAKIKKVEEIEKRKIARLEKVNAKNLKKNITGKGSKSNNNLTEETDSWYCDLCEQEEQINMIKCTKCDKWQHEKCANVKPTTKKYVCVHCL